MAKEVEVKVVGLSFRDAYPDNVFEVQRLHEAAQARGIGADSSPGADHVVVTLRREPTNEHDENAIEVLVPGLGRGKSMIGYIPRDLAARLAPSIDRGDEWSAKVLNVLVQPEHPDRPGVEILLRRDVAVPVGA